MKHTFDIAVAEKVGVNAAILFENIAYLCEYHRANQLNEHDGKFWVYNSRRAFAELYPYLSEKQVRSALDTLVAGNLLVKGNYNKLVFDRTLWYAVTDEGMAMYHAGCEDWPNKANMSAQEGQAIPDINTDNLCNKNTPYDHTSYSHTSYSPSTPRKRGNGTPQRFDDFWRIYPRHVNKATAMKAWAKLKADDSLVDTIINDVKRRLDGEWKDADIQFIPHPSTYLNQRRWEDESPSEKPAPQKSKYTRPRGEYGPSDGDYWNGMDRGQYYAAKTIEHLDDGTEIWVFPDGRKYNTVTREFYFDD